MQTGVATPPMTLVAGLRKTKSGTRLLRKLQLSAMQETFLRRITAKASAYHVPGKPGAMHTWPLVSSVLDKCTLQLSCAELCLILHLLFRSTAAENPP